MTNDNSYPFTFDPDACETCRGGCCRWGGYVWVTEEDLVAMAEIMNLDLQSFADRYVKAAYGRLSLQERLREGEYHCAMLDPHTNRCLVYPARPEQCRSFPFWENYRGNFRKLQALCPGVSSKV